MFYVRSSMNETVVLLKLDENVLILDQKHLSFLMLTCVTIFNNRKMCLVDNFQSRVWNAERKNSPSFSFIFFNGEKRIKWWNEVCLQRYFNSFHNSHLHCHKNSFQHFYSFVSVSWKKNEYEIFSSLKTFFSLCGMKSGGNLQIYSSPDLYPSSISK